MTNLTSSFSNQCLPAQLTLKGKIITLRTEPVSESDYAELAKLMNVEKNTAHLQFMFREGWTPEIAKSFIGKYKKLRELDMAMIMLAYDNQSEQIIGWGGLSEVLMRHKWATTGCLVDHNFWSKGAGCEFQYLLWKYVFDELKFHRIRYYCSEDNQKVHDMSKAFQVEKAYIEKDYIFQGDGFGYEDAHFYAFTEEEWPRIKSQLENKIDEKLNLAA